MNQLNSAVKIQSLVKAVYPVLLRERVVPLIVGEECLLTLQLSVAIRRHLEQRTKLLAIIWLKRVPQVLNLSSWLTIVSSLLHHFDWAS